MVEEKKEPMKIDRIMSMAAVAICGAAFIVRLLNGNIGAWGWVMLGCAIVNLAIFMCPYDSQPYEPLEEPAEED